MLNEYEIEDQLDGAKEEADLLEEYAKYLENAAQSSNDDYKLLVLDDNLKMWVAIEVAAKDKNNFLPQEIKSNLCKLSKYVEQVTLSKGINMTESYYKSLAEINRQISQGLKEAVNLNLAQQEAYFLARCGLDLSEAYKSKDEQKMVQALDQNQKLWIMIKTLMMKNNTKLPQTVKDNLIKLADYIAKNTIVLGKNISQINEKLLDSFININRQIAEGLLGHQ